MTTAIHIIMKNGHVFSYDSFDPVYAHEVRGNTLYIEGQGHEEYTVYLGDVVYWEFVEGPDVNTRDYFDEWKELHKNKRGSKND